MEKKNLITLELFFLFEIILTGTVLADWQNNFFIRGDVNQDGVVTQADADYLFGWLFKGIYPIPKCLDSGDFNDDGYIDISDVIKILNYASSPHGGGEIKVQDLTSDALDCKYYP